MVAPSRTLASSLLVVASLALAPSVGVGQTPSGDALDQERAAFLAAAEVGAMQRLSVGVTGSSRATLHRGAEVHDAHFQVIDESKAVFEGTHGTELGFRDTWKYNLAGYHLSRLIGLDSVPVSVERTIQGKHGALTWWIDDVLMLEADRYAKKIEAPDPVAWNRQMWTLRLFDQLIANTDRNLRNVVIDTRWKVWMIDHTRAFRRTMTLPSEANLTKVDRRLLERLRGLTRAEVAAAIGAWVGGPEIDALMARRGLIVAHFDAAGSAAVYDADTR